MSGQRKKCQGVDPAYLLKQKEALRRIHRKSILFNSMEMAAINEYCKRFEISSLSALIRKSTMERVLEGLEENHPTLF